MSSPFTNSDGRNVQSWSEVTAPSTVFSGFNPFGTFTIDAGYGSGGYGELPYGQGTLSQATFTTEWTAVTDK